MISNDKNTNKKREHLPSSDVIYLEVCVIKKTDGQTPRFFIWYSWY